LRRRGWVLDHKLTAILSADVFGYSRLMGENEEATLRALSSHRKLIDSSTTSYRDLIVQRSRRFYARPRALGNDDAPMRLDNLLFVSTI
jgi:hypothetical protein